MIALVGSIRQVNWAEQIREEKMKQACLHNLTFPEINDAKFWIDNRTADIMDIFDRAMEYEANPNAVMTAFTSLYSRYGQEEVCNSLHSLQKAVVLDTETTGLEKDKKAEVIDLAIVELDTGNPLFCSLIQPKDIATYDKDKHSLRAQKVHGITKDELECAPTLADVWPCIYPILSFHQIITWNADFDLKMMRRSAKKWNLPNRRLYGTCAMKMFSAFSEIDDLYSLDEACEMMGVDRTLFGNNHRALADTLSTRAVVAKMKSQLIQTQALTVISDTEMCVVEEDFMP